VIICIFLIALFSVACHRTPKNVRLGLAVDEIIGETAAEQTAKLLGGHGKIILIITEAPNSLALDTQLASFQSSLASGVTLLEVKKIPDVRNEDRSVSITGSQLLDLLKQHPDADALVSFVGGPKVEDLEQLPEKRPKWVVVMTGEGDPQSIVPLVTKGIVQVAIIPNSAPAPTEILPKNGREYFAQHFVVITSPTAAR
jgi:ABC-type sugar transport system substrate-binding protein